MQQIVFLIVLLALAARTCIAEVAIRTLKSEQLATLFKVTIDLSTTCYGDPSYTIGVVGDSDGSIIKTLWSIHSIPAVLVDSEMKMDNSLTPKKLHRLQVFIVVVDSEQRFYLLMMEIMKSIWWNHYANFLIINPTDDSFNQCTQIDVYLFLAFRYFGVLNAQAICLNGAGNVSIINSNPFTRRAPEPWEFLLTHRTISGPFNVFKQTYREGGQACKALNFPKTLNLDGYPFYFMSEYTQFNKYLQSGDRVPTLNKLRNIFINKYQWIVHNIALNMNATPVLRDDVMNISVGMLIAPFFLSDNFTGLVYDSRTYPYFRDELFGVTQHTGYMSQLEKILSVIDRPSRIGMWIVYLITFLFFKFFLRQAIIPSILDLVRLTCGQGLVKLPTNVAPTIYLACLFMFVVTLQGIYTGNLATLLTTNIHYPNVNRKQDIVDLGYTIYTSYGKYFDDPIFNGRVVSIDQYSKMECVHYVLRDPLAICVNTYLDTMLDANDHALHLSRDVLDSDYMVYELTRNNPFLRRLDETFTKWFENGLRPRDFDKTLELLHANLVNDKLVNNNPERKVMDLDDLLFAFVILGIGLTCSFVCFIGELMIYRIRLKIAKRRDRALTRLAWK